MKEGKGILGEKKGGKPDISGTMAFLGILNQTKYKQAKTKPKQPKPKQPNQKQPKQKSKC